METEHITGVDGDELMGHERQLLEAQFGRSEERLTDQRVVVEGGG